MNEADSTTLTPDKQLEGLVVVEGVGSLRIEIPSRLANPRLTVFGWVCSAFAGLVGLTIFLDSRPDSAGDVAMAILAVLPVVLGVLPFLGIWFNKRIIELDAITLWTCSQVFGLGFSHTLTIDSIKDLRAQKNAGWFGSTTKKEDSDDEAARLKANFAVVCDYQGKVRKLAQGVSAAVADRVVELILERHPELAPVEQGDEEPCPSR